MAVEENKSDKLNILKRLQKLKELDFIDSYKVLNNKDISYKLSKKAMAKLTKMRILDFEGYLDELEIILIGSENNGN